VTDSGDGGEGGGDELPCATEGEGGCEHCGLCGEVVNSVDSVVRL